MAADFTGVMSAMHQVSRPIEVHRAGAQGIALVAAISRAAVGAHWPLDILVGSAAGLLFALIEQKLTNDIWWLQSVGLQRFAAGLMTLTCIAMLFHDSRYPGTNLLTISAAALALLALSRYWYTSLYIERKARK